MATIVETVLSPRARVTGHPGKPMDEAFTHSISHSDDGQYKSFSRESSGNDALITKSAPYWIHRKELITTCQENYATSKASDYACCGGLLLGRALSGRKSMSITTGSAKRSRAASLHDTLYCICLWSRLCWILSRRRRPRLKACIQMSAPVPNLDGL
jgi:hypothetical protein